MDKITWFSDDELLVKILSFLPTKVAVSTSILSKQWKFLWMRVPKLEYDDISLYNRNMLSREGDSITDSLLLAKSLRMLLFIDKNLPLHSSPVIESLCLTFYTTLFQPEDIKLWVEIAVSRCAQELSVNFYPFKGKRNALLPSSLYTCKSLVTLKLRNNILVDVPHVFCLPSLKTLHLQHVIYADEESLQRLLSNCSVLEDLVVERSPFDNVRKFAVIIPSLLSLSFEISDLCSSEGYVIDTPSLKYFKATDISTRSSCLTVNMPKLEEADIITAGHNIKKLLKCVTSVKRLSLLIQNNMTEVVTGVYGDDIVFDELKDLKFSIYNAYWSKLLYWLLKASPKLRNLKFKEQFSRDGMDRLGCWNQLTSVPQCLWSSLQTFKWLGNHDSIEGKALATYILRKSCRLKTATISIGQGQNKLEMEREVKCCFRGSPTCNLVFS
ncbi:putative FBD-associated F-box protein At5g56410 [Arabidopsis lyrata subsp. lyrata]|uniref:putative FBD-associated F-box protein At5g56410 n=1 Tax=Arabidopsis lyrata subsp. lyrata TaxID=81972 RepID=UPI000A29A928|nr:putative FBD-associated F-box protein At5g56410 [Arabidopsis lyrata subsp. lyrata]|eukprot:XP_020871658.1 putative FBD-associated F-box protein At5g56410 [Arabidopsis lyrata subsp. lyrata]